MTIICYRVFLSGQFCFQYQLINLVLPFLLLCTLVHAVVQKYHEMSFIIMSYIFSIHFAINLLAIFAQLKNADKIWNNNHTVHLNEQNQIDHVLYCSI